MKKLTSILLLSLAFLACTNTDDREHRDNAAGDTTLPSMSTTNKAQIYTADVNLNGDEKVFLLNAHLSLQRLSEFAHLGSNRAISQGAKDQSVKMHKQYSKMLGDLEEIAKGKGLILSSNEITELPILRGQAKTVFMTKYVELLLKEHANLTTQLDNGTRLANANIKNFSNNALTVVDQNSRNIATALK